MNINTIKVGDLRTNCYVIEKDNKCIVIDPGAEYEKIQELIGSNEVIAVIVTHSHYDHVGAIDKFDKKLIYDINNLDEKEYEIENFKFEVIYTPGHKEDSITIYFRDEKVMFTGDFLFKGTIGRTDLVGSDHLKMIDSLNRISKYDGNTIVYPGHGDKTCLKNEFDLIKKIC